MVLLLVFLMLALGLFALFLGGGLVAQGYLYQDPADRFPIRAAVAGLLVAGYITFWVALDQKKPGRYDTFFNFMPYTTTEFDEFEAVRWTGVGGTLKLNEEIRVRADTQAGNKADISFRVEANTSPGILRDLIFTALKDKGFDVEKNGDARLTVQNKGKDDHLVRVRFDGPLQQFSGIKAGGLPVGTVKPKLNINGADK